MAILVRAFLIEEINSWDETALYDHLRANPLLLRRLGFETLPNQRFLGATRLHGNA
jgi:putative transposase